MLTVYWFEQRDSDVRVENDWLSASESDHLRNLCFEKRRNEWRLGRWTAKSAIAAQTKISFSPGSFAGIEIRSSTLGAPEAFRANRRMALEISLTHRAGRAACALAQQDTALGCDLELVEPRGASFVEDYLVASEQNIVSRAHPQNHDWLVTLLWSAKESALKSLHTGLRLDTYCVIVNPCLSNDLKTSLAEVSFTSPSLTDKWYPLEVRSSNGANFSGWWQYDGVFVRTVTAIPQPSAPVRVGSFEAAALSSVPANQPHDVAKRTTTPPCAA